MLIESFSYRSPMAHNRAAGELSDPGLIGGAMSAFRWALLTAAVIGSQVFVTPVVAGAAGAGSGAAQVGSDGGTSCLASWTQQAVSSPPGSANNDISSITGTSATSLYAAGVTTSAAGVDRGRLLRDTGSGWHDLTVPTGSYFDRSQTVAPAANEAWFSGAYTLATGAVAPAVFHVVANTVTRVPLPANDATDEFFDGGTLVASAGGSDLWATADYSGGSDGGQESLLYHRTSTGSWTTVTETRGVFIDSIAAISPTAAYLGEDFGLFLASGGSVSPVTLPGRANDSEAFDIAADGPNNVWVATVAPNDLLHFNGTSWTSVPLPTADGISEFSLSPNGVLWAIGQNFSTTPYESTLARFDPLSQTWAATNATAATTAGNLVAGSAVGLLALGSGSVYMSGSGNGPADPVIASLCQLPVGLSGGPTSVVTQTLGDGVLVNSPRSKATSATVSDTTGLITTGALAPGQSAALPGFAAATYTLRTTTGTAKATLAVPPTSSTTGHRTTVTVATKAAPKGYAYKLQIKAPGSTTWQPATLSPTSHGVAKYLDSGQYPAGNYLLRSQVQRPATPTAPAVSTGWSPEVTAVVSPH